ncbi:MAG: helix-turn-helix transcriptional regulator [Bacteroidota bacterium]
MEMQARLHRMALHNLTDPNTRQSPVRVKGISQVEKMAIYIAKNQHHPIKVAEIGNAVNLHPDYANAIFKKAFGRTLNEYLTEERIAHAQRQLVVTNTPITQISFACGFNSISRFNAAFRKISQCTPRDYRRRYR